MFKHFLMFATALALLAIIAATAAPSFAARKISLPPPAAPAGSTGVCNDGTYTTSQYQDAECKRHGGARYVYHRPKKKRG